MILVFGATGNVGSGVVTELVAMGRPVRAFVRDEQRARAILGDDVELASGDLDDPASVERALEGVDRVFVSSGDGPRKVDQETNLVDRAVAAGVGLVVKASTVRARAGSPLAPFDWNGRIEDHLRRSPVASVILQSAFYMTNLLAAADSVSSGTLAAPAGQGRVAMVDPRDTAAAGAAVLAGTDDTSRTHVLTGPAAISYAEVAANLAESTGRPVAYVDVPEEAARAGLAEAALPDWLAEHLIGVFALIRAGAMADTTDTVRTLTGRAARTFADFARDHARAFDAKTRAASS